MSRSPELYQWRLEIAKHFPHLSQPMVMGLALWSLGMIMVRSCSLTAIADWWSCRLGQPFHTVRERLRDTYREAEAKAGAQRTELDLDSCWAPWLNWVLAGWSGTQYGLRVWIEQCFKKINYLPAKAGRLKSWLEAGNHSKECSSLQRDIGFIVRFVRIDMVIDGGIDHLMGHNDGEKPCDYLCCTRSLRSDVHQIGLRFNVVMAS